MKRILAFFLVLSMTLGCLGTTALADDRVLNIGIGSEFSNIVPMSNNVALANRDGLMVFALYDPLLWYDTETNTLKPWIATEWTASEDGLTWNLTLRDDVYFHNGTKLTAEDVAFTVNLCTENPIVSIQNFAGFDHAEVVDDTHVKIIMSQPFAATANFLASYHLVMLSKAYYEEVGWEGYQAVPIGTGPYAFVNRVIGGSMTLAANEQYFQGAPAIKDVKINILPDANAQILALETGEIDVLQDSSIQNCQRIEMVEGLNVSYTDSAKVCFAMWGSKSILCSDENLRKAIAASINYDAINTTLNAGHTKPVTCLLVPGINGRPDDGTFETPISYDLEEAKAYLANSGYQAGPSLKIICTSGSKEEIICKVIQGNLQELGINAELAAVDGATFMTFQQDGDYDISVYSTLPSLYDANLIFQQYDRSTTAFAAKTFPEKDEIADLCEATLVEMDPVARKALFAQVVDIMNKHAHMLYLYQDCNTIAYDDKVTNIHAIPGTNYRIADWAWAE